MSQRTQAQFKGERASCITVGSEDWRIEKKAIISGDFTGFEREEIIATRVLAERFER